MNTHSPSPSEIDWDDLEEIEPLSDFESPQRQTVNPINHRFDSTSDRSNHSQTQQRISTSNQKVATRKYVQKMKSNESTRSTFLQRNHEANKRYRQKKRNRLAKEGKSKEIQAREKEKEHESYLRRKQKYQGHSTKQRLEIAKIKEKVENGAATTEEQERLNVYREKLRLQSKQRRRNKKARDNM